MTPIRIVIVCLFILFTGFPGAVFADSTAYGNKIYDPGHLSPVDSHLKVTIGEKAPDFSLPSILGPSVRLSSFQQKKNVMLTFIPAAWTPVCSDQWPGYNIAQPLFEQYNTILLGISTDNLPTLFAWTREMGGLWFDVLSDFWPHGAVSSAYGILRTNGTADRAVILIDKEGIIRFIHVSDINIRPDLGIIAAELKKLPL